MDFCPKCGTVMLPNENKLKCKCGFEKDLSIDETNQYSISEEVSSDDNIVMVDKEVSTLPTTNETCPKCSHNKAFWWLKQTRSADEAETRFFRCTECKHSWREYD